MQAVKAARVGSALSIGFDISAVSKTAESGWCDVRFVDPQPRLQREGG